MAKNAGKGDQYRSVDRKRFERNFDRIFRKKKDVDKKPKLNGSGGRDGESK